VSSSEEYSSISKSHPLFLPQISIPAGSICDDEIPLLLLPNAGITLFFVAVPPK
jgi:hypothetical protein